MRITISFRVFIAIVFGALLCFISTLSQAAESLSSGEQSNWDLSAKKGLRWRSAQRDDEIKLGGRLHADKAYFRDDLTPIKDDSEIRRARAYASIKMGKDWRFRIEREFADGREGWRNLWAKYKLTKKSWLKAGNFVAPFGLEDIAASNHATFMERSLPSALAPSYQTGVAFGTRNKFSDARRRHHYSWVVSVGSESLGDDENDRHRSSYRSIVSRFAYAPIAENDRLLHLAISAEHRNLDSTSTYRVRSRPESSLAPGLLNTGNLADVNSVRSLGLESAVVYGAFSAQGEYMRSTLSRGEGRPDPTFDGWYVQTSYVLTGEKRRYSRSTGSFKGIRPSSGKGAIEIAARVSELNLIDETVRGGQAKNLTLGINWYVNSNVRLMFNYIDVDAERRSNLLDDSPSIYQFRVLTFL